MKMPALMPIWPVLLSVALTSAAHAEKKLSKEDKRWLEQEVAVLITPEETEIFKDIDSKDRDLFKEIFWARRDPNPSTPENEFRKAFEASVEIADRQLTAPGSRGSTTDIGQVFVLLGNPDHHDQENEGGTEYHSDTGPRESMLPPISLMYEEAELNPGAFPETGFGELDESDGTPIVTWIYSPNPSLGFPTGLKIQFRTMPNFSYRMIRTEETEQALERVRTIYISNPSLTYALDGEGRLIKPGGDVDPESPAKQILNAIRNTQVTSLDLSFKTTIAFFRSTEGAVYIPILFELSDAPAAARDTVFGLIENTDGEPVQQFEEQTTLFRGSDGRTLYEIPTQAPPGRYKLYLGIRDDESEAVGTHILDLDVPDYSSGNLVLSSVVVYNEGKQTREPAGTPGHAFQFGTVKFRPARTFTQKDTLGFFFFVYGLGFDAGAKPNVTGQYIFYKDGKRNGQTKEEPLLAEGNHAVGNAEIPLSSFEPGNYRIEVKVTDRALNQVTIKDVEFVLKEAR